MDNFNLPPMRFHNFVRMLVLPADFAGSIYFFYLYFIKEDLLLASAYRYAIYALFVIKAVQTIVNIVTQAGFLTYSGYAFYGILVYFGLRVIIYLLICITHIEPVLNRNLPDIIKLDLLTDIFFESSLLISIATMGIIVLYYYLRKDAFFFREPREKRTKRIKERNYPWKYNEKYKPARKPFISHRKLHGIKDRRLDTVAGKEKSPEESPDADVNEGL